MDGYPTRPTRDDTSVIGARIGAQIVDSIAVGLIVGIIAGVIGAIGGAIGGDAGSVISAIGFLLGAVAGFVYFFLLEGLWDGYTVGKKLFGIKVVEEDGAQCSLSSAFVRNLLEIIDGLFYYLIGFIAMAASDKRQRLGDRLAGTVVVRETPNDTSRPEATTEDRATMP